MEHQRLLLDSILTRKGVVTVKLEKIQSLSSQIKEGVIVVVLVNEILKMIQSELKGITIDVRLVFGNLTISFFVVDKPVRIVNDF